MTYGEGISKVNTMILRIVEIEDPNNKRLKVIKDAEENFLTDMRIEPVFAYGFPKDKMDELQRAQLELQMKLGSRREIMERIGKQNIPELLQEIDEDAMQQAVVQMQIQKIALSAGLPTEGGEGNPTPEENGNLEENNNLEGLENPIEGENEV